MRVQASPIAWATATTLLALVSRTGAAPTTIQAAPFAGSSSADVFPPSGKSKVGFPGPTPTGVEPAAIQTAKAYPYNDGNANHFPLIQPQPYDNDAGSNFDISKYWGNLSPWYSLRSSDYGLSQASPLAPEGCEVTQMHLLYRHGARYPTSGAAPSTFAQKIANSTKTGLTFSGELAFLSTWTYKLGAELLTPFGRSQNFLLGVEYRQLYGHLLNNFTAAKTIPVFRTESQDRMVKTAENFAAGFFGVPEYMDQVNIEILVESIGVNNSGASYDVCPNSNIASRGSIGSTVASRFAANAFNSTINRLQTQASGITFTSTDAIAMLQMCSYETHALGYSAFCNLFTEEDFLNYEYYYDLSFYYNNGPGSPVSAAQGKGYLDEYLGRFTGNYPSANSALNQTFDNTSTYFPLSQSIYADATHEVVLLDALVAFNLTALFDGPPLSAGGNRMQNTFVASKLVPFATHFTTQVLSCPAYTPTKQIRFIVNDAVVPINESHPGCPTDPDGLCSFDTVVSVLQKRSAEIDFDYDCFGNYTASAGSNYNGRAPRG
ncbi:phosphoglycerate mutase-like protein [Dothidotthia symphoricarpi CBS 119687]|uniref:3-phytase n=1 Tax=Dothidotthia symphoricarpi CBS 119687 TaxID=1392245 RepID=A0A6A6ABR2_9PLEO|nr:phosphoglycerate mutase-like protein [Dothidotthia symphoricarpi CBS 119687]KAF2128653.1 phosphoglycerate mutase-like protein [Dothidotthia symphoricarpi CBS 119687]